MKAMNVKTFLESFENPFHAVTIDEHASLDEVLETFLSQQEQRCLFVLDSERRLKGVIVVGSLARHIIHEEVAPAKGFSPSTDILRYLTVEHAKDIMEKDLRYCTMDEPLESVIQKMFGKRIYKILPVVDEEMRLIDVVSIVSILEYGLA